MTTPLITFVYPPKYYRRADGEEDVDDVNTKDEPDLARAVAKHFRPLVCLPGLRFVPTMMNLVKMMKMPVAPAALEGNVGKGRKDALATIHAVRTIEITDRTSTLIKAANHLESLKNDPVLQVFKTFGQYAASELRNYTLPSKHFTLRPHRINDVVVRPHISFTTADEIPADICEVAESNHLNTVVIPWQHPKDAAAVLTYSQNHKVQTAIVRGVLAKFDKTVAVVVDRGQTSDRAQQEDTGVTTPLSPAIHNILVPFYGGPDDREALMFALNMRFQDNVRIVVLRVKLTSEVLQGSTSMEPENGVVGNDMSCIWCSNFMTRITARALSASACCL